MEPPRRRRGGLGTSSSPTQPKRPTFDPGPHLTGPEPDHSNPAHTRPAEHDITSQGPAPSTDRTGRPLEYRLPRPREVSTNPPVQVHSESRPAPRRTGRLGHRYLRSTCVLLPRQRGPTRQKGSGPHALPLKRPGPGPLTNPTTRLRRPSTSHPSRSRAVTSDPPRESHSESRTDGPTRTTNPKFTRVPLPRQRGPTW